MNSHLFTNRSRQISFGLLLFVGTMMMAGASRAGGGSGVGLKVTIEDAVQTQAIWVGLGILIAVYTLIIFEWVHRTLAAAVGGLMAVLALNYYAVEDTFTLAQITTMIDWETIGLLLGMMVMVGSSPTRVSSNISPCCPTRKAEGQCGPSW